MPSKMLIEAANAFHRRHAWNELGLRGATALVADLPAVLQRVRALRDELVAGALKATQNLGSAQKSGRATLLGPGLVEIGGKAHATRSIIIATGSRPRLPDEWLAFGDRMLTTDTLFEQPTLGPRIAVIGMGPLGVEMAQALARLGLQVSAFSTGEHFAGIRDAAINTELAQVLKADMRLYTGAPAELREVAGGIEVRSGNQAVVVDQVVAAMGARPTSSTWGWKPWACRWMNGACRRRPANPADRQPARVHGGRCQWPPALAARGGRRRPHCRHQRAGRYRPASSGAVRRWPLFLQTRRRLLWAAGGRTWTPTPPSPVAPVFMTRGVRARPCATRGGCAFTPTRPRAACKARRCAPRRPSTWHIFWRWRFSKNRRCETCWECPSTTPPTRKGCAPRCVMPLGNCRQPADSDLATCGGIGVPALE